MTGELGAATYLAPLPSRPDDNLPIMRKNHRECDLGVIKMRFER